MSEMERILLFKGKLEDGRPFEVRCFKYTPKGELQVDFAILSKHEKGRVDSIFPDTSFELGMFQRILNLLAKVGVKEVYMKDVIGLIRIG